jgi:RNA polymerase sigma-70 factor (ECF subfamily)
MRDGGVRARVTPLHALNAPATPSTAPARYPGPGKRVGSLWALHAQTVRNRLRRRRLRTSPEQRDAVVGAATALPAAHFTRPAAPRSRRRVVFATQIGENNTENLQGFLSENCRNLPEFATMSREQDTSPRLAVTIDGQLKPDTKLMELVYDELRLLAGSYLRNERAGHTLQATALVHEAYVRISEVTGVHWQSPAHFFAFAAEAIRRVLVDHARRHNTTKRGGGQSRLALSPEIPAEPTTSAIDLLDLNTALEELANEDDRAAKTVELRYFGGLTVNEVAEVLQESPRSVANHWAFGKAWLYKRLRQGRAS